ncbi:hypothetical protein IMG5_122970 [Ichthyophthirius multifiliis]|uniref:Ion transport domain-containing protein n=1 Tax=Ichthyophthirius multifiliis TaxID=5932 RepID=G0QVD6_ICHMU|nr:hypothetical protein IMG5_122970 [Ichthyophthirius multifiliis]EGR30825.1 hypothetical protein IMG5_122970 [Ichthyophthirius multifiliis]|eukprot:XP_004032412.1 hypothetical protein IMG5_122970 [Ichthyophthirius multifiliis]
MQIYGGQLNQKNIQIRQNFDTFQNAFITVFQVVTLENWNDILYKTFNSNVHKAITSFYLISWIFIGNWIFLNLFLAILLDGFSSPSEIEIEYENEDIYEDDAPIEAQGDNTYIDEGTQAFEVSSYIDIGFNIIFTLEAFIKIVAFGFILNENSYLTESWSQIDFFIVVSALVDMSFDNVNIPAIKILRMLRTLRPLRFISHNVNMKVVVIALFESVSGILNVLIVIILIWLMFAILSISLIGNRMSYCQGLNEFYGVNQQQCLQTCAQRTDCRWSTYDTNFDNIISSMTTLYIISSLENWPGIMFQAIDSNLPEIGPVKDNYQIIQYFFVSFILVGSFFLVNLFVGVIFLNFNKAQQSERRQSSLFLTEEQSRWIEFQQMIIIVKAEFAANREPRGAFRLKVFRIVNSRVFEVLIMVCIVLNIISMGLTYEGSSLQYESILENINYFFTATFIMELILKLIATGLEGFWISSWNKFDLFVVISSIIDIVMNQLGSGIAFLRIGPQLVRIVRVMRISRLLKLIKSMQKLQKIIDTLAFSFPSLMNVGALLFLLFFIYAILGVFLFKDIKKGNAINNYNNFFNFVNALITLFRCSTGENWYIFMFDCGKTTNCIQGIDCGTRFSTIYYVTFILMCTFIMLNLFILIIIQYFEDYYMKDGNPLQAFNEKVEIFRATWSKYTAFSYGEKIESVNLVNFLHELEEPLGYNRPDKTISKKMIAKDVMQWNLTDDGSGNIYFNDVLFACMRKAYGSELINDVRGEIQQLFQEMELKTKLKIAEQKKKSLLKNSKKIFNQSLLNSKKFNPMIAFMFLQITFKTWNRYTLQKINNDNKSLQSSEESEKEEYFDQDNLFEESYNLEQENKLNIQDSFDENEEEEDKEEELEEEEFQIGSLFSSLKLFHDNIHERFNDQVQLINNNNLQLQKYATAKSIKSVKTIKSINEQVDRVSKQRKESIRSVMGNEISKQSVFKILKIYQEEE